MIKKVFHINIRFNFLVNRNNFPLKDIEFAEEKDTYKENLTPDRAKISGEVVQVVDKKIHNFAISCITKSSGIKRKIEMDVIESIVIRGQQDFETYELLNPIKIKIEDNRAINALKNTKMQPIVLYQSVYFSVVQ